MDNLEKKLRNLKSIGPDKKYAEKSRMLILASPKITPDTKTTIHSTAKTGALVHVGWKNIAELLRFSGVFAIALFVIFSILGGVSYINKTFSPLSLEGLNQKSLTTEAKDINSSIQITLSEIQYLDQANKKAINTANEISKNNPVYSNIATTSTSTDASTTEDINNYLITSPTSTNVDNTNNQDVNSLLDKAAQ